MTELFEEDRKLWKRFKKNVFFSMNYEYTKEKIVVEDE